MIKFNTAALATMSLSALFTVGSISSAQAAPQGGTSGGGGNALICFNDPQIPLKIRARDASGAIIDGSIKNEYIGSVNKVEILDLWEAKLPRGLDQSQMPALVEPRAKESVEQYTERIISRLDDIYPELAANLRAVQKQIPAAKAISFTDGLLPVNDYSLLGQIDSKNCVVGTIATHFIQNEQARLAYDPRLMKDKSHSPFSMYVTYLHEVVYMTARTKYNHIESTNTRKLIGALLQQHIETDELFTVLAEANFSYKYNIGEQRDHYGNSTFHRLDLRTLLSAAKLITPQISVGEFPHFRRLGLDYKNGNLGEMTPTEMPKLIDVIKEEYKQIVNLFPRATKDLKLNCIEKVHYDDYSNNACAVGFVFNKDVNDDFSSLYAAINDYAQGGWFRDRAEAELAKDFIAKNPSTFFVDKMRDYMKKYSLANIDKAKAEYLVNREKMFLQLKNYDQKSLRDIDQDVMLLFAEKYKQANENPMEVIDGKITWNTYFAAPMVYIKDGQDYKTREYFIEKFINVPSPQIPDMN